MVPTRTVHNARINLRLSETTKQRIERATSVEGKTLSAFIVSSALATVGKTIDRHETLTLARNDALRFFMALWPIRHRRTTASAQRKRSTQGASTRGDRVRDPGH